MTQQNPFSPDAAPRGKKSFPTVLVVVGVLAFCLIGGCILSAGIFLPALGKARQTARGIKSGAQVRAITTALAAYQVDHGDYPPQVTWTGDLTTSGYITTDLLAAPDMPEGGVGASYIYVYRKPPFQGDTRNYASTVWVYEQSSVIRRHMYNVAYLDGHVDILPREEFEAIINAATDDDGNPLPKP